MPRALACAAMGLLLGCALPRAEHRPAPALSTAATVACGAGAALPRELQVQGGIVLFGEIHGTEELPSYFGEAVCATARAGLPVEVGLEIPVSERTAIAAFLASRGEASDVEALTSTPFWTREFQDGRSSRAMLALLQRLRALRSESLPVHVFVFDVDPSEMPADRDRKMAESVASRSRAAPHALTMVLVGEVHTWKAKGAPWNPEFLPMGWHLEHAGLAVRSLGRSTPAGSVWVCTSPSPSDCGTLQTKATEPLPSGRSQGIELLPRPSPQGHDGLYATTTLTVSPPAR